MKNKKRIITILMLIIILVMVVAYSTFATNLEINGIAEIKGIWDIRIVNIEVQTCSEGCDAGSPQYDNTSAIFDAKLEKPGDMIVYLVTIKNEGLTDAKLETVIFMEYTGSPVINYETTELKSTLDSGEQTSFLIKVRYDENCTEMPEDTEKKVLGIIEYVQKE